MFDFPILPSSSELTIELLVQENAFLRFQVSKLVEERTAELMQANEQLAREIAERRRAEEGMEESNRRLSDILSTISLVAVCLDCHGRITFCNDYLLDLTGWSRHEVLGRDWFDLFTPPETRDALVHLFTAACSQDSISAHHENDIITREGEHRVINWSNTLLRDTKGNVIGTASIGQDVSAKRQTEDAIRSQAELIELTHDSIMVYGLDGQIIFWNRGAELTFGWSKNEAIGKRVTLLLETIFPLDCCTPTIVVGRLDWPQLVVHNPPNILDNVHVP